MIPGQSRDYFRLCVFSFIAGIPWTWSGPENEKKKDPENGKNGPKISGHFSHFTGHVSPIFQVGLVRPKSIFRPFSSPFRANGSIPGPRDSMFIKNPLMPLFLMGCFPVDFQEVKRPLGTKSVNRPIKVGKRPINEGKRPIKAKVLVGVSVGSLMGCFRAPPPWRKTAPLKRPITMSLLAFSGPKRRN